MTAATFAISPHLQNERFILIVPGKKVPTKEMNGWAQNRATITLTATDSRLQQHIVNGGNYAIVTHDNLVVVACDTVEVEQIIQDNLPPTHAVRSPRHKTLHFYYYCHLTHPINCIPSPQGDPVADIKYGNAYVLAAGSSFENYGQYKTIQDLPIATITEQDLTQTLRPYMKIPASTSNISTATSDHIDFPITNILPPGLTRVGDEYRGPHPIHGSTTGHNFAINTKNDSWYCFRCNTGGGSLSLLAILHGIATCEELQTGLKGPKFIAAKTKAEELGHIKPAPDIHQQLKGLLQPKNAIQQTTLNTTNTQTTTITKNTNNNQQNNIGKLITALKTEFTFKTPEDTRELHYYHEGIYKPAETLIETLLETVLGEKLSTHQAKEILNHLKRDSYTSREQINKYNGYIPFQNCLLNIETLQTKPHTPEYFYTYKLNITYDPNATCPQFTEWLNNVQTPDNIQILQEYTGYILRPEMSFQKSLWLIGGGGNGKTRYALTIKNLFENNISYVELGNLNGERNFIEHELYGKLVNIASEPNTKKELQSSQFKRLTGGDPIYAEIKNQQKRLTFISYAKWIIIGNRYPRVNDDTDAFKRRIIIIKWEKQFKDGQNAIQDIEKRWTTNQQERSGIINWALQGLQRLYSQGHFSETQTQEQNMIEFNRASDSTASWLQERVTVNKNQYTLQDDSFEDYKTYCDYYSLKQATKPQFYGKLRNTPYISERQIKHLDKRPRVWHGITLNPPLEQEESADQEEKRPNPQQTLQLCTATRETRHFSSEKNDNIDYFQCKKGVNDVQPCTPKQPALIHDPKYTLFSPQEAEQINNQKDFAKSHTQTNALQPTVIQKPTIPHQISKSQLFAPMTCGQCTHFHTSDCTLSEDKKYRISHGAMHCFGCPIFTQKTETDQIEKLDKIRHFQPQPEVCYFCGTGEGDGEEWTSGELTFGNMAHLTCYNLEERKIKQKENINRK